MRKAAHVLSLVLHPVWMPTLALLLAFTIDPHLSFTFTATGRWIIVAMVFAMTAIFPLTSTLMLWRSGAVSSLAMPIRHERIVPYILTLIYFVMTYYLLRRTPNPPITLMLFTGIVIALALTLLITMRWKISSHMVGIGGVLGMVLALMIVHRVHAPLLLGLIFLLTGALGTARLLVTDHVPAQIYAGLALGLTTTMGCMLFGVFY